MLLQRPASHGAINSATIFVLLFVGVLRLTALRSAVHVLRARGVHVPSLGHVTLFRVVHVLFRSTRLVSGQLKFQDVLAPNIRTSIFIGSSHVKVEKERLSFDRSVNIYVNLSHGTQE